MIEPTRRAPLSRGFFLIDGFNSRPLHAAPAACNVKRGLGSTSTTYRGVVIKADIHQCDVSGSSRAVCHIVGNKQASSETRAGPWDKPESF